MWILKSMLYAFFISFVRGKKPGQGTGFDIKDDDLLEMEQCRELVVASAIFGNHNCILIVLYTLVLKDVSYLWLWWIYLLTMLCHCPGNYDMIQHPRNISEFSKANACFYMFVDEETEAYVKNSSSLYNNNKVGLWRLVVVRNLPYEDPRRTGKVPFLLIAITISSPDMCFFISNVYSK